MVKRRAHRSWRRVFGVASVLALASLGATLACGPGFMQNLTGGIDDDGGIAVADAGEDRAVDASRTCAPETVPERPTGTDVPPRIDLVFAVENLRADTLTSVEAGAPPARGIDLDNLCTCPEARACVTRDAAAAQCDDPNGRDNGLGRLFNAISDYVPEFKEDFADTRIRSGRYTLIIDLRGWNGNDDDQDVIVALIGSQGLDESVDGGTGQARPRFDGNDVWTVDPASLSNGDLFLGNDCRDPSSICVVDPKRIARGAAGAAYVRGGTLIARFAAAPIAVQTALGKVVFDFSDLTLAAKLSSTTVDGGGSRYKLEGELLGRWPSDRVLAAIGNVESFFDPSKRLCESAGAAPPLDIYAPTKDTVCNALDLGTAQTAPCTELSSALSIVAGQTKPPSTVYRRNEAPSPCDGWRDDCSK